MIETQKIWMIVETEEDPEQFIDEFEAFFLDDSDKLIAWNGEGEKPTEKDWESD